MMLNGRKIPKKNYFYLGGIILASLILIGYFYMWFLTSEENKLTTPIMGRYLQVINYNEMNNYLIENKDAVIYVSVLENETIRSFEKSFKKTVSNNGLGTKVLYLDLTDVLKNKSLKEKAISEYSLGNFNITNVPSIVVFKGGKLTSYFNIKDHNYNQEEIVEYLSSEGIIE